MLAQGWDLACGSLYPEGDPFADGPLPFGLACHDKLKNSDRANFSASHRNKTCEWEEFQNPQLEIMEIRPHPPCEVLNPRTLPFSLCLETLDHKTPRLSEILDQSGST